jgi:hypothetical protein
VFREPVLEERVGHPDRHRLPILGAKTRGPEPGVEAVAVYLRLDAGKDVVPDAHFTDLSPAKKSRFFRLSRSALAKKRDFSGLKPSDFAQPRDFPQFFPQVWKTLGRDQTCMELLRGMLRERTPTVTHLPLD